MGFEGLDSMVLILFAYFGETQAGGEVFGDLCFYNDYQKHNTRVINHNLDHFEAKFCCLVGISKLKELGGYVVKEAHSG